MRLENKLLGGTSVEDTMAIYTQKRDEIEARYFELHTHTHTVR